MSLIKTKKEKYQMIPPKTGARGEREGEIRPNNVLIRHFLLFFFFTWLNNVCLFILTGKNEVLL